MSGNPTSMGVVRFQVRIERDPEDRLYYADCLDLQGCHTFGKSRKEALERIQEVILDHLQARFQVHRLKSQGGTEMVAIEA